MRFFVRHSEGFSPKNLFDIDWCKRFFASLRFALNDGSTLAFTLAEVLITLTIIGVIAAITIPNLMQSWKKHQVEAQLKETYSILSNAIKIAGAKEGLNSSELIYNETVTGGARNGIKCGVYFVQHFLLPTLKVKKTCYCPRTNNCPSFFTHVKTMESTQEGDGDATFNNISGVILENGSYVGASFWPAYNVIDILVDINGAKAPNQFGRDIFFFGYTEKGLSYHPVNGQCKIGSVGYNPPWSMYNGFACAQFIMKNSWKIPDDYPVKKW